MLGKTENEKKITRRQFVKKTVQTGMGVAAVSSGLIPLSDVYASDSPFEFIIVGSGAGGGTLAANLAKAGKRVLLIEAGSDEENNNYRVPSGQGRVTRDPLYAWDFWVKHYADEKRQGLDTKSRNNRILYPRAGTLGGCTAHNAMITMCADNQSWDNMAKLVGDPSFGAQPMRRHFMDLEKAHYSKPKALDPRMHGHDGWLHVEQTPLTLLLRDPQLFNMVRAAVEEGEKLDDIFKKVETLFDGGWEKFKSAAEGLLELDCNDWERLRQSAAGPCNVPKATFGGLRNGTRDYLMDVRMSHKKNLTILTNCLATEVLFEGDSKKAKGVSYLKGSKIYQAALLANGESRSAGTYGEARLTDNGEVILSGGAFNTPQLLLLSGIGPEDEIGNVVKKFRLNRPGVGKNMQDRYEIGVVTELDQPLALLKNFNFALDATDPGMAEFNDRREDSAYQSNGVVIGVQKKSQAFRRKQADLFVFGVTGDFQGYDPEWADKAVKDHKHITIPILKGHTTNTAGVVTLNSERPTDPTAPPDVLFNYFDTGNGDPNQDLDSVLEGVKFARQIGRNRNFPSGREVAPGEKYKTDDDLRDYIRINAWGHHASCSNKMGLATDINAVVDSNFKVIGIENVRVVDASVFPKIPGLFIVVPIYQIAQKATETILKDTRHA